MAAADSKPNDLKNSSYYSTLLSLRKNILISHIMTPKKNIFAPEYNRTARSVLSEMKKKDYDMAPIIDASKRVKSYILRSTLVKKKLSSDPVSEFETPLRLDRILPMNTPVLQHLQLWQEHSYYIVISSNKLAGVVTFADLNKPPVRLIFYTILSEIETKLRRLLRRRMPKDSWMTFIDQRARDRINDSYNEDKNQNLEVHKATYLQFGELLSLFDNNSLYQALGYGRKQDYIVARKELNDFRINIMHSQPLVTKNDKMRPSLRAKLDLLLDFANRIPIRNV